MTYEQYRTWILNDYPSLGSGSHIDQFAGSASGGTAVLCTYPLDLARPTLVGMLPYAGLKFYIYEELKRHVPVEYEKTIAMHLSCGALAGLFGQTFTYPLDVVRRQMQVGKQLNSSLGDVRFKNTWHGLTTIVRNQGWKQLFAGLSINYIKTSFSLYVSVFVLVCPTLSYFYLRFSLILIVLR
ncbi:hypothetical protein UlMin_044326 [Ulmus minor]